jgi:alpha-beta hydrolase superfamily lysophospholipase
LYAAAASALFGLAVVGAVLYLRFLSFGPPLEPWHTHELEQEFTAERAGSVRDLAAYGSLEDRLFAELEETMRRGPAPAGLVSFNRFESGSRSDPGVWPVNWNRSFELGSADTAVGAVLLLHGLTDSPYSLRALGESLAVRGYWVIGLRLPGHGTAPSGLLSFEIEDMQAAVRLAMRDMRRRLDERRPIFIAGYSNGAALAVEYTLDVLDGEELPAAAGLVLISPALGVSPLAVLGRIKTGLSRLPGLGRAAWQQIEPEYDPFKYSSFSLHAAGETRRLTVRLQRRIARSARNGGMKSFPPVIAFLSAVDSTVKTEAVVDVLFEHLDGPGHELVLFDVNRRADVGRLMVEDPGPITRQLLDRTRRSFALTVVSNLGPDSSEVAELRAAAGEARPARRALGLAWPAPVFSLSHVALPFPPDDPLYGYEAQPTATHVQLGRVEAYGENGVLAIPSWLLTRQRSNPFFPYLLERVDRFLGGPSAHSGTTIADGMDAEPAPMNQASLPSQGSTTQPTL